MIPRDELYRIWSFLVGMESDGRCRGCHQPFIREDVPGRIGSMALMHRPGCDLEASVQILGRELRARELGARAPEPTGSQR